MPDKKPQGIGERIKQYRQDAGLSQAKLAKKAGLNTNAYAKIERDISEPTQATIKKLCKALGITATELLGY